MQMKSIRTVSYTHLVCAMNDIPLFLSGILGIGVGFAFGVLNGILVTKLKVTHVIATLGSMYVARGLSYIAVSYTHLDCGAGIRESG